MSGSALGDDDRLLVRIAALAVRDPIPDFRGDVARAARAGVSPDAIRETLVQIIPYAGWPAALNALLAAEGELQGAGLSLRASPSPDPPRDAAAWRALGLETARRVNPRIDRVADALAAIDPSLVDHLAEAAYGFIYGRPGLSLRQRELIAVTLLCMAEQDPQLRYHIQGAIGTGATLDQLRDLVAEVEAVGGEGVRGARAALDDLSDPLRGPDG